MIADGHKWLNVPYEYGFAFVQDPSLQPAVFARVGRVPAADPDDPRPTWGYLGPEMSRRARALPSGRRSAPTAASGYRAIVERHLDLAQHLAAIVDEAPDLERLADVPLNIVCFRYRAARVPEDRARRAEPPDRRGRPRGRPGVLRLDRLRRQGRVPPRARELAQRAEDTSS